MKLRSMTGFAQVKGQVAAQLAFALSLKAVNHRFLDLHFRLPSDTDSLEMKLRRILIEKLARGHVEVILNLDRSGPNGVALNRQLIAGYVEAFRAAADEFGVEGEPDLNVVLRMPGALDSGAEKSGDELETAVLARVEEALSRLNEMREEEGRSIGTDLRARMADEFGVEGEPDLNVVLRMPGALDSGAEKSGDELETAVLARVEEALSRR